MNPDDYMDDLLAHEGCCAWPYCDKRGLVTTGIGNLVASPAAMVTLPWFHRADNSLATNDEKAAAFDAVKGAYSSTSPQAAGFYRAISDLRLGLDYVHTLARQRLVSEFIPGVIRVFPGFPAFPLPARRGLIDMEYSLGVGGLLKFHTLVTAANSVPPDWMVVSQQCHRAGGSDERNAWTANIFKEAAGIE